MNKLLLIVMMLVVVGHLKSQQIFNSNSEIVIDFSSTNVPFYTHSFKKGQSLYSLAKIFNTKVEAIEQLNHVKAAQIDEGQQLIFPLKSSFFLKSNRSTTKKGPFIPIVYYVKKSETLYRIAKLYCNENVVDMKLRNNLKSNDIPVGYKLIIGWWSLEIDQEKNALSDVKSDVKNDINSPISKLDTEPSEMIKIDSVEALLKEEEIEITSQWRNTKGVAVWDKSSKKRGKKFVLHPSARINSTIELYNPMVNRTVMAKVIGRIPPGAYTQDVDIVLSPATASSLGALDARFLVQMKYVE